MNQQRQNIRIIIWSSCAAYVLLVTLLLAYAYGRYGVVAPFAVLLVSAVLLQLYKMAYKCYAVRGKYDLSLAIKITNCWTIYQILNMTLLTGGLFAYTIMLAERETLHIPEKVWLLAIIIIAYIYFNFS